MSCFSCFFLKYFAVFWLAFSDAQLQPPSEDSVIVLNSGETKSITWRYNGLVPEFTFKSWIFSGVNGRKVLARIDSGGLQTFQELNIDFRIIKPFTLVLRNVNETYNGTYSLNVFSITTGSETSTVDVFIAVPPTIDVNCSDTTTLNASASFSCQCNAKNGNPPVNEVKWYKDPRVLSSGTEMAILKIEQANRFDNGQYKCEAMGHEKSKAEKTIELIVNYKPVNVQLTLQREGDKATLTCTAKGNPPPRYEIFLNGLSVVNGSTLVLNEVSTKNVGDYTCRATNNLGMSTATPSANDTGMSTTTPSATDTDMKISTTSIVDCKTDWLVTSISFISGIIFGILFCCLIFLCYGQRWLVKKSQMSQSYDARTNTTNTTCQEIDLSNMDDGGKEDIIDPTYQGLDVSKMNKKDNNYQPLLNKNNTVDQSYEGDDYVIPNTSP